MAVPWKTSHSSLGLSLAVTMLALLLGVTPTWAGCGAQSCQAKKLSAAARAVRGFLLCESQAATAGGPVDPGCLNIVQSGLADDFVQQAEAAYTSCDTYGDAARISRLLQNDVEALGATVRPTAAASG